MVLINLLNELVMEDFGYFLSRLTSMVKGKLHFHLVQMCLYWPSAAFPFAKPNDMSVAWKGACEVPAELFHSVQDLHVLPYGYWVLYLDWVTTVILIQLFLYHLQPGTPLCSQLCEQHLLRQLSVCSSQIPKFLPTERKSTTFLEPETTRMRVQNQ